MPYPDLSLVKNCCMKAECVVGDDEDGIYRSPSEGVHERVQVLIDFALGAGVDGKGRHPIAQPFPDFIVPVLKERF
jgi:hypothetical protein